MILVDPDRRTWRYLACETHERRQNNAHSANRREIVYRVVKEVCGSAGQSHSHGVSSCSQAWIWRMLPTVGQSEPRRSNVVVTGSEQAWPAVCPGIPEVASTKHNKWWLREVKLLKEFNLSFIYEQPTTMPSVEVNCLSLPDTQNRLPIGRTTVRNLGFGALPFRVRWASCHAYSPAAMSLVSEQLSLVQRADTSDLRSNLCFQSL